MSDALRSQKCTLCILSPLGDYSNVLLTLTNTPHLPLGPLSPVGPGRNK